MPPLACITCGPAHEPIDGVRRITNFSTGEIGTVLSQAFVQAGYDVICLRSETATFPPPHGVDVCPFSTNDSLAAALQALPRAPAILLHAAALCDFVIESIEGAEGTDKLSSRSGTLRLNLKPAPKILPNLRAWFPEARIIGWKYELDGPRDQAFARALAQIHDAHTDACVLNGAAYGPGFGLLLPSQTPEHLPDKASLAVRLTELFPKPKA